MCGNITHSSTSKCVYELKVVKNIFSCKFHNIQLKVVYTIIVYSPHKTKTSEVERCKLSSVSHQCEDPCQQFS